ncbi:MAG: helix-hairpin-helix domain-containing protein [Prolixibacteraceae bacterium]|jgi:competence protein ComEA|nr:helix-hairpin-helix domain-containing protein [Prolixibacteraceae bacterium]
MRFRHFFDELMFMSKAQRNASFVLVGILVFVLVIKILLPRFIEHDDFSDEIAQKMELLQKAGQQADSISGLREDSGFNAIEFQPFYFDPNRVSYSDLLKLGFEDKTANIFINYRKSGAVFHDADDMKKVYGLDSVLFSQLKAYVAIPEKDHKRGSENTNRDKIKHVKADTNYFRDEGRSNRLAVGVIDLNTADTTSLKQLPGIGSVFASRICNFRNYLSGFHSIEQLQEVYNLSEETYQAVLPYVRADTNYIKKININFCSVDDLKKHPYCSYYQARDVIDYRSRSGEYKSVSGLLRDSVLSQSVFNKLKPYLTVKVEYPKAMK